MNEPKQIPCPFVYANGRACGGFIRRARLYGGRGFHNVRKIRLWCSEKDNHAGAINSFEGKRRMEFYPDQLSEEILEAIENGTIPQG